MGEVYRARDTTLDREVALKVLPQAFTSDPERLARFEREAKLLATVNHPHIAHIYGLEEADGQRAIVLELVEGPSLADRIAQGPIPPEEAIPIARQIAEALEAAHERGIVHRDLKPANVKVSEDGTVKVLDFGLAKAWADESRSGSAPDISQSPTLAHTGTAPGVILGTAPYMSPEQARGRAVDKRADIWAFGVVFFEMLTGKRLFAGETVSDTLAGVLRQDIDWSALPTQTPGAARRVLRRCLERDPKQRLRDIGEARIGLQEVAALADPTPQAAGTSQVTPQGRTFLPWAVAAGALGLAALAFLTRQPSALEPPLRKLILSVKNLKSGVPSPPALSPDGRRIVYVAGDDLWVRELDQIEPRLLVAGVSPSFPFWSPDAGQVAYLAEQKLWRVPVSGGQPVLVADAGFPRGATTPGGAWLADDTLVFAPAANGTGLLSVPARGGQLTTFLERNEDESDFHKPSVLPDGHTVLFVIDSSDGGAHSIGALRDGRRTTLLTEDGSVLDAPVYSPTGHLLFVRTLSGAGAGEVGIWAIPFSADRLEVTGEAFPVAPKGHWPTVAQDGTLLYAAPQETAVELVRLDAQGRVLGIIGEPQRLYRDAAFSPDGKRLAVTDGYAVQVHDLERGTQTQLTFDHRLRLEIAWTPDGRTLVHSARRGGYASEIWTRPVDGTGSGSRLGPGSFPAVSPDGRRVMFQRINPGTEGDLYLLPLDGGGEPEALLVDDGHVTRSAFSPDGRYVAYVLQGRGQTDVFLRRASGGEGLWQVSKNGGDYPRFSRAGDRLFYVHGADIIEVPLTLGATAQLGAPRVAVAGEAERLHPVWGYDVAPDGSGFVTVRDAPDQGGSVPSLTIVQSWFAEFR